MPSMTPFSLRIIAIPLIALAAAIGAVLYFRAPENRPSLGVAPQAAPPAQPQQPGPAASRGASPAPPPSGAVLPQSAPAEPGAGAGASPPEFDIVRVTPNGETVVAGRAPGAARVELLDQGKVIASEKVDATGQFVLLPPALAGGDHLLALRITPEGQPPVSSKQSVAVAVRPGTSPVVTLAEPGKPSIVLAAPSPPAAASSPATPRQQPQATAAAPASGQVTIRTAEVEAGGRFFATGTAPSGSTVRLYLNGSHVADAAAGADGQWSLTINKGVSGGRYALRADALGERGEVLSRAEVPFDAPAGLAAAAPTAPIVGPGASPLAPPPSERSAGLPRPPSQSAAAPARSPPPSGPVAKALPTPPTSSDATPDQTGSS